MLVLINIWSMCFCSLPKKFKIEGKTEK